MLAVVALLVMAAVVLGIVESRASRGFLDPDGVDAAGARALARLLTEQGVQITPVRAADDAAAAAGPADTILITAPDLLTADQAAGIVDTGARLVLVAPSTSLAAFAPELDVVSVGSPRAVEPDCDFPAADRAGAARLGGYGYPGEVSRSDGERCYPLGDDPALVVTAGAGGAQAVLVGTGEPLTNQHLDQDGNAALALGLLGESERLVWFRPAPVAAESGDGLPLTDLLPDWVTASVWQLAVAAVLAAGWRARRLGRVVVEPLPVVVRASETTEGRARLYRRGRSREHAAATLRAASTRRLAAGIRSPAGRSLDQDAVDALAAALAARVRRSPSDISTLLAGPPPADDAGLVRLAHDLDALEKEARTP